MNRGSFCERYNYCSRGVFVIHAAIQLKHSIPEQVFITAGVSFHSHHVLSIKTLSNLLCNFHMGVQFSYGFAISESPCMVLCMDILFCMHRLFCVQIRCEGQFSFILLVNNNHIYIFSG